MKLAAVIGSCVIAFLAGRYWPRSEARAGAPEDRRDAVAPARGTLPPLRSGTRRGTPPPRPRAATAAAAVAGGDDPYIVAWRADREGAERVRLAVLETMEQRRLPAIKALRACLRDADIHGMIELRFAVAVESTPGELRVGGAVLHEVTEGPPVPDTAADCLARLLDGDDVVPSDEHGPFLDGYVGDIRYIAGFLMR